jgi:hypothetical protein
VSALGPRAPGIKVDGLRAAQSSVTAEIREDAGYTAEEIDKLRRGGHTVICGAVRFWRPFIRLDLIDELQLNLFAVQLASANMAKLNETLAKGMPPH